MKIKEILTEKRDEYCSDKCCGSDVKAEDCNCPPSCPHCNCNAVKETATAGGTSAGGVASTGNGFANGGAGTLSRAGTVRKKKPKKQKR
jgi:hypothetical protein